MPLPRRILTRADLHAICASYSLGAPISSSLAHEGTSSLYRMVCLSPRGRRTVALKVQDRGVSVYSTKSLEALVLSTLRPRFPFLPTLLRPGPAQDPMTSREWGVTSREFAISLYEWVDGVHRYRRTTEHRSGTVEALGVLQNELNALPPSSMLTKAIPLQSLLEAPFTGFRREFAGSELRRLAAAPLSGLGPADLSYLDRELELVRRTLLPDSLHVLRSMRGLVHADFSPGNCGYRENGEVSIVFDFESIRQGVLPLIGSAVIGRFSLDSRLDTQEVIVAMQQIVRGLRQLCPSISPPPGLLLPLMRLAYLDAIWRQLNARKLNRLRRWGFLQEDMENVRWLRSHGLLVAQL